MAIGIILSERHSAADSRELPLLLFASIQEGARLPDAEVNVCFVGALQHVSRVDAPGHNAILANAALATVNLVLQQVVQEHLGSVLAEVVLVLDIGAKGDTATGTAKGCDLFDLFIIFALALKKVLLLKFFSIVTYHCHNAYPPRSAFKEKCGHIKWKVDYRVIMAKTSVHFTGWTQVHHSSQLSWPGVPHNFGRVFAIAEVWVAGYISDNRSNWVFVIVKRSSCVGPILVQAVTPFNASRA